MLAPRGNRSLISFHQFKPVRRTLTQLAMQTLATTPQTQFAYQKAKPLSDAEFKFRIALADYASVRLLPILQRRTVADRGANQYNGINVRLAHSTVYLEAIL